MIGNFFGMVDFGGGPLTSAGRIDIFLAKFEIQVGIEDFPSWTFPYRFDLHQNHPNPFHNLTAISYQLRAHSYATLKIFDITGRLVETLVDKQQEAGFYQLPITSHQLPGSGIYFYRLQAGDFTSTKKLVIIK
jgi:hypothetical protein